MGNGPSLDAECSTPYTHCTSRQKKQSEKEGHILLKSIRSDWLKTYIQIENSVPM